MSGAGATTADRGCIGILSVCPHLANVPVVSAIIEKLAEAGYEVRVFAPSAPGVSPRPGAAPVVYVGNPWTWEGYGWSRPLGHRGFLRAWALRERLRRNYRAMLMVDATAVELAAVWAPVFRVPQLYCSLEILVEKDLPATAQTLRRWHGVEARLLPAYRHYILPDEVRAGVLAAEYRLDPERMICIPNSWRNIPSKPKTGILRRMFGLSATDRILIYAGNIGPGFGLEEILASVANWPEHWKLVLHSSFGAHVNSRIAFELDLIRRLAPPGRVWLTRPDQAPVDYWDLLADADAGIAFYTRNGDEWGWLTNNQVMGYASGKINTYLRAGLPVITNRYTNLKDMILDPEQAGVAVESAAEIAAALRQIDREGNGLVRRARRAYENRLDPEPGLERLLAAIQSF